MLTWAQRAGHRVTRTRLFCEEPLPGSRDFDALVVMGGPMNIYETDKYPWFTAEKEFLTDVIRTGRKVLGVCLGAQLITDVLGARVTSCPHKEIGWFPVYLCEEAGHIPGLRYLPGVFTAFHWHGDVFDIPKDAVCIASSTACPNQGFVYGDNVLALQFHLESTQESVTQLVHHCGHELVESPTVQSKEKIEKGISLYTSALHGVLERMLEDWLQE